MERGTTANEKKGRFVTDEERWFHKYDALVQFYDRYGHTNVPFPKRKDEYFDRDAGNEESYMDFEEFEEML